MPGNTANNGTLAVIRIGVYDGTRRPVPANVNILYRVRDGNQREHISDYYKAPLTAKVPFFDNFGDWYTVLVWAEHCRDAGFTPIKVSPFHDSHVDLMLLPKQGAFKFYPWEALAQSHPAIERLLSIGASDQQAKTRYELLGQQAPASLAALLNLAEAMGQIQLREGTPLNYYRKLLWDDSMAQDRFFGYADLALIEQVEIAKSENVFRAQQGSGVFHPGATRSYKQIQYGEANVQLTFHEKDVEIIDGVACVKVDADMDYYQDAAAHLLLEVIPNLGKGATDPKKIYMLRWIAGRQAGIPEFDPPYTIEV
jgi:hypothetical protein